MHKLVVHSATLKCSMGTAPSTLVVPLPDIGGDEKPAANIDDHVPFTNVFPFGLCTSSANPTVAAANNVPQPCVPVIPSPWTPGSQGVTLRYRPALHKECTCTCTWAGTISISYPGQDTSDVD